MDGEVMDHGVRYNWTDDRITADCQRCKSIITTGSCFCGPREKPLHVICCAVCMLDDEMKWGDYTPEETARKKARWERLSALMGDGRNYDRKVDELFNHIKEVYDEPWELFNETVLGKIGARQWFAWAVANSGENDEWSKFIDEIIEDFEEES